MDKRQNINNFKSLGLGFIFIITASALLALLSHVEYIRNLFEDLFYVWISYNFTDALHYMNGFKALITGNLYEVIAQSPVLHALPGMGIAYLINLISRDAFVTYGILLIVYNLVSIFIWYKVVRSLLVVKSKPIAIFLSIFLVAFLHVNGTYLLYVFEKKPAIIIVGLSILWLIKHFPSPHKTFRSYIPYFLSTILIGLFHTYTMLIWFGVMIGLSIYNLIYSYNQKNFKKSLGIVLASGLTVLFWAIVWQIAESYISGETLHEARERIVIIKGLLFSDVTIRAIMKTLNSALLLVIIVILKIKIKKIVKDSQIRIFRIEYAFIIGYMVACMFIFHTMFTQMTLQNFHFYSFSMSLFIPLVLIALINEIVTIYKETKNYSINSYRLRAHFTNFIIVIILFAIIDYAYIKSYFKGTIDAILISHVTKESVEKQIKSVKSHFKKILPGSSEYVSFCTSDPHSLIIHNASVNALSLKISDLLIHPVNILHDYSISDDKYREIAALYTLTVHPTLFDTQDKNYALQKLYCTISEFRNGKFNAYFYNLLACKYLHVCTERVKQVVQCADNIPIWSNAYKRCLQEGNAITCHFKSVMFNTLICVDSLSKNHYTKLVETLFTVRNNLDSVISLWNIDGVILSSAVVNNWKSRCRTCDFSRAINLKLFDGREAVLVPIQNKFN